MFKYVSENWRESCLDGPVSAEFLASYHQAVVCEYGISHSSLSSSAIVHLGTWIPGIMLSSEMLHMESWSTYYLAEEGELLFREKPKHMFHEEILASLGGILQNSSKSLSQNHEQNILPSFLVIHVLCHPQASFSFCCHFMLFLNIPPSFPDLLLSPRGKLWQDPLKDAPSDFAFSCLVCGLARQGFFLQWILS